jgi:hypothetical protein
VLAIASISLSIYDLTQQSDKDLIAVDVLMMSSAIVQLIGTGIGWYIAIQTAGDAAAIAAGFANLSMVMSFLGALAILLALIGLIVWIVWFNKQGQHRSHASVFTRIYY